MYPGNVGKNRKQLNLAFGFLFVFFEAAETRARPLLSAPLDESQFLLLDSFIVLDTKKKRGMLRNMLQYYHIPVRVNTPGWYVL